MVYAMVDLCKRRYARTHTSTFYLENIVNIKRPTTTSLTVTKQLSSISTNTLQTNIENEN